MISSSAESIAAERAMWLAQVGQHDLVAGLARDLVAGNQDPIRQLFEEVGLAPPSIHLDPALEALELLQHKVVHRFWNERLDKGRPPHRGAVDPVELRPALGNLLLLEACPNGLDYTYRVYGTRVTEHAGQDWTGWTVGAMSAKVGSGIGLFYRAVYAACAQLRRPIATDHVSPIWLSAACWRRLIVPLTGDEGTVSWFLVANVPAEFRHLDDSRKSELLRRVGPIDPI